jgi:hypothetical protein
LILYTCGAPPGGHGPEDRFGLVRRSPRLVLRLPTNSSRRRARSRCRSL